MSPIPILFELAWKSALVAGATLAVLRLAKDRTAGERSWIAHAGLAVLLALPAAALLLPSWSPAHAVIDTTGTAAAPLLVPTVPAPTSQIAAPVAATAAAAPAPSAPVPPAALALPSPETVALWLYIVPLALLALTMLVAVIRLATLRGRAQIMEDAPWLTALARAQRRMGFKSGTALLISDELRSPISWGVVRPIILLNPKALEASGEAEAIIAHELAHVARLDWAKLLISRAACAILWFNPLVWMLAREAHQLREEAADDAVLMSEVDGADYAALLVNAARHDNQGLLIAAHGVAPGKDSLKRRITRVLDEALPRGRPSLAWAGAGLAIVVGAAAPLAAFDPFTVCTFDDAKSKASAALRPAASVIELASAISPVPLRVAGTGQTAAHSARPLTPEQLIAMKAVGVTGRDLAALKAAGVDDLDADRATQAKALGITAEYANGIRRAVPGADFDDIVTAKAMGIDPGEARAMRQAYPGADLEDMAAARATGVTPGYAAEMTRLFPGVELEQLSAMRAVGVDAAFVRSLRTSHRGPVAPETAIEARAVGMPPSAVREVRRATAEARAGVHEAARAIAQAHAGPDADVDVDVDRDTE